MFAVVVLNYLKEIADFVGGKEEIAKKAEEMAKTVKQVPLRLTVPPISGDLAMFMLTR